MNHGHKNQYNIFHPSDLGEGDNSTIGGVINQYDHLERQCGSVCQNFAQPFTLPLTPIMKVLLYKNHQRLRHSLEEGKTLVLICLLFIRCDFCHVTCVFIYFLFIICPTHWSMSLVRSEAVSHVHRHTIMKFRT